ncbi:unnamed protein product, partial [Mesorhabditis spiculigera]
ERISKPPQNGCLLISNRYRGLGRGPFRDLLPAYHYGQWMLVMSLFITSATARCTAAPEPLCSGEDPQQAMLTCQGGSDRLLDWTRSTKFCRSPG